MHILILLGLAYLIFHLGHSHQRWRQSHRSNWWRRIWISVPGPFGTRIGKRI